MKNTLRRLLSSCLLAITLVAFLLTTPRAQAQTFSTLYSFSRTPDGGYPYAGLIRDAAGNLYGTTPTGGACNAGTVFKLDTTGKETVLHSFTGGADGGDPWAGLVRDPAGNLYGTSYLGGDFTCN